ncbi:MAG: Excinuclease ABC, C subunit domain protein [Candidatus Giovannonibacteria bacterium GW2011_GWA1_43_15]|uniref:Excinuclease ABC, C subunit domain protein n=1 Tax=Candidatus Giovannonibacteria bacterium GW2011_GWA2_44_26 TaxID=1618648 RepID=A0A0G1L3G1_9BACT|nr:MAG: Excinuclease ABC, C subunit domain protein [Candidatus Giovannonibacteria bacterium GW2011_GWB1_43_13]KKS99249.1 MAG: Excinuclease ABC, C subunit domain protein [Candidatus Giovannonibacteria bacterium GW2011_GWA1_43_15]KKT20983.1 MAG: Excinuclease ABC, C subunit domain protein [Candidatus Giovannonibacteria bacterium GW2011_GWC2_43_8]KKT63132.1 MAG: Excinuclease ABC, C subunit domain protein [Candidatus Giovannonibacteria bacterium GW2011_GWA2_44_26]
MKLFYRKIPQSPGVYFFKDNRGKTLYIGKAANLHARLRSRILPKKTKSISWEVLNSEVEALIREAELIKKYRPKYNILMRDDKQYFYVGFTREKYPKIFITHQRKEKADYIGSFIEGGALRSVLKTLRQAFPYCTCRKSHKRLCLNARIGRCLGFCCLQDENQQIFSRLTLPRSSGGSDASQKSANFRFYKKNIRAVKQILSGKNRSLTKAFKKEMCRLSDAKKYEDAGKIRDQIYALEKIFEHRGVIKHDLPAEFSKALRVLESILGVSGINRIEAYDIANIQGKFAYGSMVVFANGKIDKDSYRIFKIKTVKKSDDPAMIKEVLLRRLKHREWPYPQVILIDGGRAQLNAAGLEIRNLKLDIKIIALTKNKKHIGDHVFIQNHREPISLNQLPEPLKNFILHLNNEAHKFAINHYRRLHRKSLLTTKFTPH